MTDLRHIKRPSIALIKLVEATGILLGIPRSPAPKSAYKAPTPTNYDDTVEFLCSSPTNFYAAMNFLICHKESDISNDMASDLYTKILEPGFNYEEAVRDGGLLARDLFNLVNLILMKLQRDEYRIPIRQINVMALVDGSRASYVALDIATHIFSHGTCSIMALTVDSESSSPALREHLYKDISRRCIHQYKLATHSFHVDPTTVKDNDDLVNKLQSSSSEKHIDILVMGMNDTNNIGADSQSKPLLWACWNAPTLPVLLVKGSSRCRMFSTVFTPRIYQICVKRLSHLKYLFRKSLYFLRPGDSVVVVSLLKTKGDRADSRDSRHEMGMRDGWVTGPKRLLADFPPEYTPQYEANLRAEMDRCISKAQVSGRVRVETECGGDNSIVSSVAGGARASVRATATVAQSLCRIAYEEKADVIVLLNKANNKEVIVECVREASCSVAIIK
jgi:hypothetical protein